MNGHDKTPAFWIGNAILALALVVLLMMDTLSAHLGMGAMALWVALVVVGAVLVMKDRGTGSP